MKDAEAHGSSPASTRVASSSPSPRFPYSSRKAHEQRRSSPIPEADDDEIAGDLSSRFISQSQPSTSSHRGSRIDHRRDRRNRPSSGSFLSRARIHDLPVDKNGQVMVSLNVSALRRPDIDFLARLNPAKAELFSRIKVLLDDTLSQESLLRDKDDYDAEKLKQAQGVLLEVFEDYIPDVKYLPDDVAASAVLHLSINLLAFHALESGENTFPSCLNLEEKRKEVVWKKASYPAQAMHCFKIQSLY